MTTVENTSRETRSSPASSPWTKAFARNLLVTDVVIVVSVILATHAVWIGLDSVHVAGGMTFGSMPLTYGFVSALLILGWLALLSVNNTRGKRVVGHGITEYRLLADSGFRLFAIVSIISYVGGYDVSRGLVFLSFPICLAALMLGRHLWRRWLNRQREAGTYMSNVVIVGNAASAVRLAQELRQRPEAGYRVVGVCLSNDDSTTLPELEGLPVFGPQQGPLTALAETGADTIVVSTDSGLAPDDVREISWGLEAGREHLIVAPGLAGVGGPRIHTRPVAGLPLVHVETPRLSRRQFFRKRSFDLVCSVALVLLFTPILVFLALLVKISSPGPIFYRQERIGKNGKPFGMVKFRSMVVGADDKLAELLDAQGRGDQPLFKLEDDPRVTRIGRVLRKYSLDELPQLFNVVRGEMSLVGPRPQREGEVALYDHAAKRRLVVKPGMSGLWQVSGRSTLSWEDAIRLDLYYVENWSLTGDVSILFKTFKAVVSPGDTAH